MCAEIIANYLIPINHILQLLIFTIPTDKVMSAIIHRRLEQDFTITGEPDDHNFFKLMSFYC